MTARRGFREFPFALAIAAAVFLAACAGQEPPPAPVAQKTVPKAQAPPVDNAATAAETKPEATVLYNPAGKRDPFVPFIRPPERGKKGLSEIDSTPPLQRYALGELQFVGVIWSPKGSWALVQDGTGKGYTVTVGTRIGREGGIVSRITDGEMVVKETFRDYSGVKVERESVLKLMPVGGKP